MPQVGAGAAAEKVEKAVKALLNYLYHKRLRIERKHKKSQFSGIGIEVSYNNQQVRFCLSHVTQISL